MNLPSLWTDQLVTSYLHRPYYLIVLFSCMPLQLINVMINLGERLTDEEAEQMIKEADFDGDGRVSFQDFANVMLSFY